MNITMKIDGMACGMCEAHIKDAIRKALPVKKLKAKHKTGIVTFAMKEEMDMAELQDTLKFVIDPLGYKIESVEKDI